jgi:hypothetical protein
LKHLAAEPVSSAAVGKGRGLMIRSENAYLFCAAIFTLKTIILPRQARVKLYREGTQKEREREREREREMRFSCVQQRHSFYNLASPLLAYDWLLEYGEKNVTFCAIYIYKRSFYQDRLGTNIGKTQKKDVFLRESSAGTTHTIAR